MDWFFNPEIWIALLTLSTLEIVLGVDNLVFIAIAVAKLPREQRSLARKIGLVFACVTRIALLLTLAYLSRMDDSRSSLFTLYGQQISIRDLVLILGGLFLLVKGVIEIRDTVENGDAAGEVAETPSSGIGSSAFLFVIVQIAVIDIVFSLDSVVTAVGMVSNVGVMVAAIILAVAVMIFASNPIGDFIERHPTVKMLALAFLILVGVALIADGLALHIPRAYLYFAMAFSAGVEALNSLVRMRSKQRQA